MSVIIKYPFNTGSNYTVASGATVSGGQALLTSAETATDYTENFNDGVGLTYGSNVTITGAVAELTLNDHPLQVASESYATSNGFAYNGTYTNFTGGVVRQVQRDYKPSYTIGTFFASYSTTSGIDGTYGDGVLTGTATGGAAVSGGKLDLGYNDLRYVTYPVADNHNSTQTGCIRFNLTPAYSNWPATIMGFCDISTGANSNNRIFIYHLTDGTFRVYIGNTAGASIFASDSFGVWSPVAGTEYEIEINWEVTTGASRLFIDGTQHGATKVDTGTRTLAGLSSIILGTDYAANYNSNFKINDFIVFDQVQHVANYTPAAYGIDFYPTFYAGFGEDINGDWGDGVLTGTATGGASVSGGKLVLDQSDVRYVDYAGLNNVDGLVDQGCIRFKLTPDYSNAPAGDRSILTISQASGNANNLILLRHTGAGVLTLYIYSNIAAPIFVAALGAWNPVASTEYEIEINFNTLIGASRLFIDGTQFGATNTSTGTRTNAIGLLRLGTNVGAADSSDFEIDDLLIFDHPQHTSNYTPSDAGILPYEYYGDTITLPTMVNYTGPGNIVDYSAFAAIDTNDPRYVLNDQYWNGHWATSDGTWDQASPATTVVDEIASVATHDTMVVKLVTQNSIGTQQSASNVTLTFTCQSYATNDPVVDFASSVSASVGGQAVLDWNTFTETITAAGSDAVKYALSSDDGATWQYWSGAAWAVSTGYAQSNTGTEINTNISTFPKTATGMKVRVYLHSNDGTTTPNIGNLVINYGDFIYPTTNPKIYATAAITADGLTAVSATFSTTAVGDTVKFTVDVDGTEKYASGATWANSSGYAQSNTIAEINAAAANIGIGSGADIRLVAYLHSNNGVTTPLLTYQQVEYNPYIAPDVAPAECTVGGYLVDSEGNALANASIRAYLSESGFLTAKNYWVSPETLSTVTDSNGYFNISLIRTSEFGTSPAIKTNFRIKPSGSTTSYTLYDLTIPDKNSAEFASLS